MKMIWGSCLCGVSDIMLSDLKFSIYFTSMSICCIFFCLLVLRSSAESHWFFFPGSDSSCGLHSLSGFSKVGHASQCLLPYSFKESLLTVAFLGSHLVGIEFVWADNLSHNYWVLWWYVITGVSLTLLSDRHCQPENDIYKCLYPQFLTQMHWQWTP